MNAEKQYKENPCRALQSKDGGGSLIDSRPEAQLQFQLIQGVQASTKSYIPGSSFNNAPIQKKVFIDGIPYTHASKMVNSLFERFALFLEENGLKTYGIKSRLVEYIKMYKDGQVDLGTFDDFRDDFFGWLQDQRRRVKGGNQIPVLKQFDVTKMSRPAWSQELKDLKGYVKDSGDNIRHVIRNATLLRAISIQCGANPERFEVMADRLGVTVRSPETIDLVALAIYKKVYLNPDNLFSGDGPTNQVIGLLADTVKDFGDKIIAIADIPVSVRAVFQGLLAAIHIQITQVRAKIRTDNDTLQLILDNIISIIKNSRESLINEYQNDLLPAEIVGDLIADIGLNLGFDLIDGRVDEDQSDIAERQGRLIQVEVELQQYIASNGEEGDLLAIFQEFLNMDS